MENSKDASGASDVVPPEEPEDDEPVNAANNRTENDEAGMSIAKSNDDNVPSEVSTNEDDGEGSSTPNVSDKSAKLDASSASKSGNQDVKSNMDDSRPQEESTTGQKVDKSSGGSADERRSSKNHDRKSSKSSATQKESEDPVQNSKVSRQQTTASRPAQRPHSMDESEEFLKDSYSDNNDTLLAMNFNQDGGCLAVGTGSGFRICNVFPFQEVCRRQLGGSVTDGAGASISQIELLYRTNLSALSGQSNSPSFPPNKVLIWDDHVGNIRGELSYRQKVLSVKLRKDRIVVVLRDRIYIYSFYDFSLLDKVYTGENPLGLIGISTDNGGVGGSTTGAERDDSPNENGTRNGLVLACPSTQKGQVRVELYGLRRTTFVDAHDSSLGALALSIDGTLLATASERGTVIRLFDTRGVTIGGGRRPNDKSDKSHISSSTPLKEFRRGVERATVSCLVFSIDNAWLGCVSNHGTAHVFRVQDDKSEDDQHKHRSSSMTGKAMRMLPKLVTASTKYLIDGENSYARIKGVPHPRSCAFVPDRESTIAIAGLDDYGNGCLLIAEFGKRKKSQQTRSKSDGSIRFDDCFEDNEPRRIGYHRFFKCKSPATQAGLPRRSRSNPYENAVEGTAYVSDEPVNIKMNHISITEGADDDWAEVGYGKGKK